MGVGHPGHKDAVPGYVLRDFAKADQDWLDDMLRGISDGAVSLAEGDGPRFLNAVALCVAPPRSGGGKDSSKASGREKTPTTMSQGEPAPSSAPDAPDGRTALQRLADRFR